MKRSLTLFSSLLFVLLAAFGFRLLELADAENLLIARKYREAATALETELKAAAPGATRERILVLLAEARLLAGEFDLAVKSYEQLLTESPASPWLYKARFGRADGLARAGKFREAAEIYRDEVVRLAGPGRKDELASTYLGLADKALAAEKPDPKTARMYFDLAVDLGLTPEKAMGIRLRAARAAFDLGEAPDAVTRLTVLLKELPEGDRKDEAMLLLGESHRKAGDLVKARLMFRDLLEKKKEGKIAGEASYALGLTYGLAAPGNDLDLERGVAAMREFLERFASHEKAVTGAWQIALAFEARARLEDARKEIVAFLEKYGDRTSAEVPEARARLGFVLARQGRHEDAINAWRQYLAAHPAHGRWDEVQRAIVEADLARAEKERLLGKDHTDAARKLYEEFMARYPLDPRNADILELIGQMEFERDKFDAARDAWEKCVAKHPGVEASSRAQYRIGQLYESKLFDYLKALEAYRKLGWGGWAPHAQARIAVLKEKSLQVVTERAFRTNEDAGVKVISRNIEKLRARVFKLDLYTYFRATHVAGEVERLDIEVIEADQTFESKTDKYQPYQETERFVKVPTSGAGAYVVKLDDGVWEATSLVLVSDVGLIAKSSRQELFVFTQNLKDDKVEAGAKVVVSDGQRVLAEGTTDAGGVWRWTGEELKSKNSLRVFATTASGSGAGTLDLNGLSYAVGLTPKGFVYTERPAYQPGQVVQIKGILRDVQAGQYTLPQWSDLTCEILGSDGTLMRREDLKLSAFGSFAATFPLPDGARLGTWTVRVARKEPGSAAFTGTFDVARYTLEKIRVSIESERRVVFRGEKIEGKARVRYYYGEPVVGRKVHLQMNVPGGVLEQDGTTTATGEVPFSFATKEFGEEGTTVVQATLVEENASVREAFFVATTEYTPAVSLVRDVYLSGEPFEITAEVKDRAGKAMATSLVAVLHRLEKDGAEVEVARQAVATDAKEGKGKVSFTAQIGGRHRVRVSGKDRFGNEVSAAANLFVSGKDDEIKLRLLSDRQSYRMGEKLTVRVVNRAGPRLVLITSQGDGVLEHRTQVLAAGESELSVPLTMLHAPNFALNVAMMDQNRFHEAEREFLVARDLRVAVKAKAAQVRPGEEVEVEVHATDPEGRPVEAEFSLAAVDRSLLAVFPDKTPDIGTFFYGARRQTRLRTATSCTFSYRASPKKVPEELLHEERRKEVERTDLEAARRTSHTGAGDVVPANGGPASPAPVSLPLHIAGFVAQSEDEKEARDGGQAGGGGGSARLRAAGRRAPAGRPQGQAIQDHAREIDAFNKPKQENYADGWGEAQTMALNPTVQTLYSFQADWAVKQERSMRLGFKANGNQIEIDDLSVLMVDNAGMAASDQPRRNFSASGAWLSHVVTGPDGAATAKVRMPDSSTEWRLYTVGATKATLVGHGEAAVTTRKELLCEAKLPRGMTEGDDAQLRIDVHNLTGEKRNVSVTVDRKVGATEGQEQKTIEVEAGRVGEVPVPLKATSAEDITLKVRGEAGAFKDETESVVPVRPWGIERRDGDSGLASESVETTLSLPEGREFTRLDLRVEVGPGLSKDLLGIALGSDHWIWRSTHGCAVLDTPLRTASRALTALLVLKHLEKAGNAGAGDVEQLRGRVSGAIAVLVSQQGQDGGFPWVGNVSALDVRTSSQALLLFSLARRAGIAVPEAAWDRLVNVLLQTWGRTNEPVQRSLIVHALQVAGRADFAQLNALHRQKTSLPLEAAARLALAYQEAARAELAAELTTRIKELLRFEDSPASGKRPASTFVDVEARALALAALARGNAKDELLTPGLQWLYRTKAGQGWSTPQGTTAAVAAILAAGGTTRPDQSEAEIAVSVNGKLLGKMPGGPKGGFTAFVAPASDLKTANNKVRIEINGRGSVAWSALLSGFERGIEERALPREGVRIQRWYEPAPLKHNGKNINAGFGVVDGTYQSFVNKIGRLPAGEAAVGRVSVWIEDRHLRDLDFFVLEEPLPGGCSVPRDSIHGGFDHVDALPDRLLFYFGRGSRGGTMTYEIHGYLPGKYRVLPTRVTGVYRPDRIGYGAPATLDVLARGSTERDPYRMTPDELYHLGKALYDDGRLADAGVHLGKLLDDWKLREEILKDACRMMLFVSIAGKSDKDVVKYFEVLKDRYPDLVIPFDKIISVGRSYLDLGEFERGLMVFRATAEASFLKEINIAGTLDKLGEFYSSIEFLRSLLISYPDLNTIRSTFHSVGQSLARKAGSLQPGAALDPRVGTAQDLRAQAIKNLREFLILHPEDGQADEASFGLASAWLEGGDLKNALAEAEAARVRYPESAYQDDFKYLEGYARFSLGEHDKALALLQEVAAGRFPDGKGGQAESENKWLAVFLIAQIHHATGKPALAVESYGKVKERFTDAQEATDYFLTKELLLPEVETVAKGGEALGKLQFRNVKAVDVKVYRVDLMRLYILEKSLNDIRGVTLHGIKPFHEERVELGQGLDYVLKSKDLKLPIKDVGAYLVVASGDDKIASGMVLVTDLKIEVQELFDAGRMRVNVKRGEQVVSKVHVKVVGSGDGRFHSGETDFRGVFVGEDLVGQATVIARVGDSYAFHRGKGIFQPGRYAPPAQQPGRAQPAPKQVQDKNKSFEALENLNRNSRGAQERNWNYLNELYKNDQQGVQVQKAK